MTAHQRIICDGCDADLSDYGPASPRFRLVLSTEYVLTKDSSYSPPPFEKPFHFCSLRCLDEWCTKLPTIIKPEKEGE
jgi:hypothetical protein